MSVARLAQSANRGLRGPPSAAASMDSDSDYDVQLQQEIAIDEIAARSYQTAMIEFLGTQRTLTTEEQEELEEITQQEEAEDAEGGEERYLANKKAAVAAAKAKAKAKAKAMANR